MRLIAENGWTVAKTERYIDELCAKSSQKAKLGHFVLRDMRVFFNTINHQLDLIRAAGVDAGTEQRETSMKSFSPSEFPNPPASGKANPSSFTKGAPGLFGLPRCVVFISGKINVRKSWVLCVLRKILEKSNKFQKMFPLSTFYG